MPRRTIGALVFAACLGASGLAALEVRTYTASELGFLVGSHLILGEEEAILIDAQFSRSEADDVVRMVLESERSLRTIFISHGEPEHYLGLEVLTEAFPTARVLARPATVEAIERRGAAAIARWQLIYLDDVPTRIVVPEPFDGEVLTLDGEEIRLLDPAEPAAADGSHPTLLYIPSTATLVASDLILDKVHLWLADVDPAAWLERFPALRELGTIERILPGHGEPAGPGLLDESEVYLAALVQALGSGSSPARAVETMKSRFPDHRLPVLLDRGMRSVRGTAKR